MAIVEEHIWVYTWDGIHIVECAVCDRRYAYREMKDDTPETIAAFVEAHKECGKQNEEGLEARGRERELAQHQA